MTQHSETPHTVIEAVETVMIRGRQAQKIGPPIEWHVQAYDARRHLSSSQLVGVGREMLVAMPYEHIDAHIRETKKGDPDALVSMRQARRLFIAARDSIMLGVYEEPPTSINPVLSLCRSLGEVADTSGQDPDAINSSLSELEKVSGLDIDIEELASQALLSKRVERHLHTDQLTSPNAAQTANHASFHSWRKGFRRIVNAYTVHAATTGELADEEFAARGIALNAYYGHINDGIDRTR